MLLVMKIKRTQGRSLSRQQSTCWPICTEVVSLEDSLDWRHRMVQPPRVLDQRSLDSCAAAALITVTEYMYLIYTGTYYELSLQHAADLPDACNFPNEVCANFNRYCFSVANDGGFFLERDYPYTEEFPDSDSVQA
ncbi:hypothetical protein AQUCO_00700492v1 [Aquilegia coerulea]|uniref:Peptidase C1A papain C-terminal domain-containing protein n=1 Tax=Aquilegia coerulea TaxID=218851 RepID=A0A2G5EK82_AQUCA|nr:hypothetical protein AQUCO_00700492v1 [Aquilegia coerulea]